MEKFPSFVEQRKKNYARLYEGLKDLPQIRIFRPLPESDPSWFGFLMTIEKKFEKFEKYNRFEKCEDTSAAQTSQTSRTSRTFSRNDLAQHLEAANIQTRNLFAGNIVKHPCMESLKEGTDYRVVGSLANTDTIMNSSLWIGLYPGMGDAKLDYMIKTIREFCTQ